MHQIPLMMRSLPKVIIGMVNGPAVGAGLGLALACDLRIAGRSARFATGFANVGYSGDFGGSWLLTRLVGTAKARELYFLNEMLDAEQAAALGMVNRVVDDAALRDETLTLARRDRGGAARRAGLHEAQPARGGDRAVQPRCWRWRASTRPAPARPRTIARQWRPSRRSASRGFGDGEGVQSGNGRNELTPPPLVRGGVALLFFPFPSPAPTYAPRTTRSRPPDTDPCRAVRALGQLVRRTPATPRPARSPPRPAPQARSNPLPATAPPRAAPGLGRTAGRETPARTARPAGAASTSTASTAACTSARHAATFRRSAASAAPILLHERGVRCAARQCLQPSAPVPANASSTRAPSRTPRPPQGACSSMSNSACRTRSAVGRVACPPAQQRTAAPGAGDDAHQASRGHSGRAGRPPVPSPAPSAVPMRPRAAPGRAAPVPAPPPPPARQGAELERAVGDPNQPRHRQTEKLPSPAALRGCGPRAARRSARRCRPSPRPARPRSGRSARPPPSRRVASAASARLLRAAVHAHAITADPAGRGQLQLPRQARRRWSAAAGPRW